MCWLSFEAHSQSNLIILKNVGLVIFNPCQFCNTSATKQIGTSISRRALCGQVISDGHHRHGSLDKNQSVRHCHQCIWHAFNYDLRQPSLISLMLYLVPSPAHYKNSFFRSRKKGRPSTRDNWKVKECEQQKIYYPMFRLRNRHTKRRCPKICPTMSTLLEKISGKNTKVS